MEWRRSTVAFGLSCLAMSGIASAHEFGGSRFEAPIPPVALFGGAGITVALTAVWLGESSGAPTTQLDQRSVSLSPTLVTGLRYGMRALFFVGLLGSLIHGFVGPQVEAENLSTVFVWAVWLKGVGLFSVLFGSPWRVLSPWWTLYDGLCRLEGREVALIEYPTWLGHWPALVGFVAGVGIAENLSTIPRSPATTSVLVAGYAAVMVLGAVVFGERWLRRADALAVLYRLFGRVAVLEIERSEEGYRVALRPPWTGCTRSIRDLSLVAFVVATVYTVSFDGFTDTPEYQTILFTARDVLGSGSGTGVLLYIAGLYGFVAAFLAVSVVMARIAGDGHWSTTALAFAPTVLPIAAAYEVAHNYPFVLESVGRFAALGWSLVAVSTDPVELLDWLTLPVFWGSQVILIVAGHVVAVVAAHHVALDRYGSLARARRAHLPLVALMVGYTVLSLWIISRPVVG